MYFDGMSMEFFNKYRGKLKLDNHPSTALQYNALGRYLLFLIETLPSQMLIQDVESLKGKYEETVDSYKISSYERYNECQYIEQYKIYMFSR